MKNAVFTIVARNYIGLAQVLEKSVKKHSDAAFFIFVADEFNDLPFSSPLPANVLIAREKSAIKDDKWEEMAFKYNLVEFCTAIKPFCFQHLFDSGYEKVVYLDPDIYVFNSLQTIFSELDRFSIILTPHIISSQTPFQGGYPDYLFLVNGTFNLGFLALKNNSVANRMLYWWKNRLENQCFFDNEQGMATDQKWANMLPALFDPTDLHISKNAGFNLAPWNYHERKLSVEDGQINVVNRIQDEGTYKAPLVFVHFSGYDYRSFTENKIEHKSDTATVFNDLQVVFDHYSSALQQSDFAKFSNLSYQYNYFRNGKTVSSIQRRIYRRLLSEGIASNKPFETGAGSFYNLLQKRKLIDHSTVSSDKVTNKTIKGFDRKLKLVNFFFRTIKSIFGIRRYSILVRFLKRYLREENQAFLFDKTFDSKKMW